MKKPFILFIYSRERLRILAERCPSENIKKLDFLALRRSIGSASCRAIDKVVSSARHHLRPTLLRLFIVGIAVRMTGGICPALNPHLNAR